MTFKQAQRRRLQQERRQGFTHCKLVAGVRVGGGSVRTRDEWRQFQVEMGRLYLLISGESRRETIAGSSMEYEDMILDGASSSIMNRAFTVNVKDGLGVCLDHLRSTCQ